MDPISSAGPIKRAAVLLFNGWGYNFYREANKLRADDLLVRAKVTDILAQARMRLHAMEMEFRREYLPPLTRERPLPDAASVAQAKRIERCGGAIESVATQIMAAPAPANDMVWLRHRNERGILEILQAIDLRLTDDAIALHDMIFEWVAADIADAVIEARVEEKLVSLRMVMRERSERLTLMV